MIYKKGKVENWSILQELGNTVAQTRSDSNCRLHLAVRYRTVHGLADGAAGPKVLKIEGSHT